MADELAETDDIDDPAATQKKIAEDRVVRIVASLVCLALGGVMIAGAAIRRTEGGWNFGLVTIWLPLFPCCGAIVFALPLFLCWRALETRTYFTYRGP